MHHDPGHWINWIKRNTLQPQQPKITEQQTDMNVPYENTYVQNKKLSLQIVRKGKPFLIEQT